MMKTAADFFDRIKNDEAFANEFNSKLTVRRKGGANNYYDTVIPAAEEYGYAVTEEDIDELLNFQEDELSED